LSTQPNVKVLIPFRDRGIDQRRAANLKIVLAWWRAHGLDPLVVDDGLSGNASFNRHRAYNQAVAAHPSADVFVFTEADMLLTAQQISDAVALASAKPGLVVPFRQYRYLSDETTAHIRDVVTREPQSQWADFDWLMDLEPVETMDNGASIGAVNVISRDALQMTGGFTEATSGNWYDDNIIAEGFAYLTGNKTRYVEGAAVHLYHLPGWKGDHLTDEDKAATARNKELLIAMREDLKQGRRDQVKALMEIRLQPAKKRRRRWWVPWDSNPQPAD
jgi:hypothetical protein